MIWSLLILVLERDLTSSQLTQNHLALAMILHELSISVDARGNTQFVFLKCRVLPSTSALALLLLATLTGGT